MLPPNSERNSEAAQVLLRPPRPRRYAALMSHPSCGLFERPSNVCLGSVDITSVSQMTIANWPTNGGSRLNFCSMAGVAHPN